MTALPTADGTAPTARAFPASGVERLIPDLSTSTATTGLALPPPTVVRDAPVNKDLASIWQSSMVLQSPTDESSNLVFTAADGVIGAGTTGSTDGDDGGGEESGSDLMKFYQPLVGGARQAPAYAAFDTVAVAPGQVVVELPRVSNVRGCIFLQ